MVTGQPRLPYPKGSVRIELGRRSAWIYGNGVKAALTATGTPSMRCPVHKAFTLPIDRLADVLAYLEHGRRLHVELVQVDR